MKSFQLQKLLEMMLQEQATRSQVQGIMERILANVPEIFHIVVDERVSLGRMIGDGKYDYVLDIESISDLDSPVGSGLVWYEGKYFNSDPDRGLSTEDAIKKIVKADEESPWEPMKLQHLLALGAAFPAEQRQFPIIALGDDEPFTVIGVPGRPALNRFNSERTFGFSCEPEVCWNPCCRFPAVRRIQAV